MNDKQTQTAQREARSAPPPGSENPTDCEWEVLVTEYFQLHAPTGACAGCKWLRPEDPPTKEKTHWCVLVEGKYRDQDCHLCPGVTSPNVRVSDAVIRALAETKEALRKAILSTARAKAECTDYDPAGSTYEVDWLPEVKDWARLADLDLDKHDPTRFYRMW